MLALLLACGTAPTLPATAGPALQPEEGHHEEIELAVLMFRLQVHVEKLWHAGEAENWPLAGFYLHELDETREGIVQAGIVEDGHDISALAHGLDAPLAAAEAVVEAGDRTGFTAAYDRVVHACNACHVATDYGFVVIIRPEEKMLTNQRFAPAEPDGSKADQGAGVVEPAPGTPRARR